MGAVGGLDGDLVFVVGIVVLLVLKVRSGIEGKVSVLRGGQWSPRNGKQETVFTLQGPGYRVVFRVVGVVCSDGSGVVLLPVFSRYTGQQRRLVLILDFNRHVHLVVETALIGGSDRYFVVVIGIGVSRILPVGHSHEGQIALQGFVRGLGYAVKVAGVITGQ